jgi:hypothetical protein
VGLKPAGFVVMQHAVRLDRPVKAYRRWMDRIPDEYREAVLGEDHVETPEGEDTHQLRAIKHYRSLMPLAMEARKPMFALKPADGAIGSHMDVVRECYNDFLELAATIAIRCDMNYEKILRSLV